MTAPPALPGWLFGSGHIAAKGFRFACVGLLSGATYAAVTALLVRGWAVPPVSASIVGYAVSVPANFALHRDFSFRSAGNWAGDGARFALSQALNVAVAAEAMDLAVWGLHRSFVWGMAGTVTLIPVANFLLMNFFVFRRQHGRPVERGGPA